MDWKYKHFHQERVFPAPRDLVTEAARTFWKTIAPHAETLMKCPAPQGEIGIYKGRKNELFHFCMDSDVLKLAGGIEALHMPFHSPHLSRLARFASCGTAALSLHNIICYLRGSVVNSNIALR